MDENEKKSLWAKIWERKVPIALGIVAVVSVGATVKLSLDKKGLENENKNLKNENKKLTNTGKLLDEENKRLEGENRELRNENKRLGKENGNLNYQLGKEVAKAKKRYGYGFKR